MEPPELECGLELKPAPDGEIALAFEVRNPGSQPVEMRVFRPFFNFELTVQADDGAVPVIQPPFNVRVQPETITLAPGETLRLATPIQLRFDPDVPPSGGDNSMRWSLRHAPAPVRVRATLDLAGIPVEPCEARFDPRAAQ